MSTDFNLETTIEIEKWALVAGTYDSNEAMFYFNGSQIMSSGSVAAPTSYSLDLLSNVTLTHSRIKLFVLSFWNALIPLNKLL